MKWSRGEAVAVNAVTAYLRYSISFLVSFLLIPVMLNKVGQEDFGLWSLIFSILGVFGLLDIGLGVSVLKYVAQYSGEGNREKRNQVVSAIFLAYLALAGIGLIGLIALMPYFCPLLTIPIVQQEKALFLLWILACRIVVFGFPLNVFRGVLFGEQRLYLVNGVIVLSNVLYGLGAWLALIGGYSIVAVAWISLGVMLFEHVLYILLVYRFVDGFRLTFSGLHPIALLKEVGRFSSHQFIVDVAAYVLLQMDLIIVNGYTSLSEVAIYAIALKLTIHAYFLIKQFVNTLSPLLAELKGQNDNKRIAQVLVEGTHVALVPGFLMVAMLCVVGREAVLLWVGAEFERTFAILFVLMLAMLVGVPKMVASLVLAMTGHHRLTSRAAVISVMTNAVVSIALVGPLGLLGVALGTLVAQLFVDYPLQVMAACRRYAVDHRMFLMKGVMPALLPGVLTVALLYPLKSVFPPSHIGYLVLFAVLACAIYGASFWLWFAEEENKQRIRRQVIRIRATHSSTN